MPCFDIYSGRSYERPRASIAAEHYRYLCSKLDVVIPPWAKEWGHDQYDYDGGIDPTAELCALVKTLTDGQREKIVYNAHSSKARGLADWVEEHDKEDVIRLKREEEAARKEGLIDSAMAKLTPDERRAVKEMQG